MTKTEGSFRISASFLFEDLVLVSEFVRTSSLKLGALPCASFHVLAKVHQYLISMIDPDESDARVFEIEDDIYRHGGDGGEADDVNHAALLAASHAIPGQQRTDERGNTKHYENDGRRMKRCGGGAGCRNVEHRVQRG